MITLFEWLLLNIACVLFWFLMMLAFYDVRERITTARHQNSVDDVSKASGGGSQDTAPDR